MLLKHYTIITIVTLFSLTSKSLSNNISNSSKNNVPEVKGISASYHGKIIAVDRKQKITVTGNHFQPQAKVTLTDTRTGEVFPDRHYKGYSDRYGEPGYTRLELNVNFKEVPATWTIIVENPDGGKNEPYSFEVVKQNNSAYFIVTSVEKSEKSTKGESKARMRRGWYYPLGERPTSPSNWLERGPSYDKYWEDYRTKGIKRIHLGVDYPAKFMDPVYAISKGAVIKVYPKSMNSPACLAIRHETKRGSFVALYAHLDPAVDEGQLVKAGEKVGIISFNENHLHFGICWGGEVPEVDPAGEYGWGAMRADYYDEYGIPNGLTDPIAWLETQSPTQ